MMNASVAIPHAIPPRHPHFLEIQGALMHKSANTTPVAVCISSSLVIEQQCLQMTAVQSKSLNQCVSGRR